MGLKAQHDDFQLANYLEWRKCGSLREMQANVNLMVNRKKDLNLPDITFVSKANL